MNARRTIASLSLAALLASSPASSALADSPTKSGATATPSVPPASQFSARVDNPWYPLKPGTIYTYRGVKDGQPSRDILTVTHRERSPVRTASSSRIAST